MTTAGISLRSREARIPIKRLQAEIEQIFVSMGFQVFNLPEIETDYYNFEALNMPRNHPARDAQDTFYFDETMLLRTHCTSVDVHAMETMKPPIRAVSTGKVYRRDPFDATHSPMFHQVDVVVIDEGIHDGRYEGHAGSVPEAPFQPEYAHAFKAGIFPIRRTGRRSGYQLHFLLAARDARSANKAAGLRFWAPGWFIPRSCGCRASMIRAIPVSHGAWESTELPFSNMAWTIFGFSSRTISDF